MKKYLLLGFVSIFLLLGLFFYQSARLNDGKLHLIVCDVGQGDGILIRTPNGTDILIDGGPDDSILNCLAKHLPFWDRTIELMVLTHPHADHLTGLISVLQRYIVLHFVSENVVNNSAGYKKLTSLLADKNLSAKDLYTQDKILFTDKTTLTTVWPEKDWFNIHKLDSKSDIDLDLNGFSVIQLLSYGNFKALLTGDAGFLTEDKIALKLGKINVLKVPHHGSKTGMSDYFLSSINPNLAIISVGAKNRYGHPNKIALDLLAKYNIKTLRTDKNGEVEVITDGKTYSVVSN